MTHSKHPGRTRYGRFLLGVVLACSFGLATDSAWAQDLLRGPIGGGGGSPVSVRCPPGTFLLGLDARAGDDVDSVHPVCGWDTGNPPGRIATASPTASMGGRGGASTLGVRCPDETPFVRGLQVRAEGEVTIVVDRIDVLCGRLSGPLPPAVDGQTRFFLASRQQNNANAINESATCPPRFVGAGIHGRHGALVDAIGLICAPLPGVRASLLSSNIPGNFIRHANSLGELTPVSSALDRADSTFIIGPSLNGDPGTVSFESVNFPNHFLRHQGFRVKLQLFEDSALYAADASFIRSPGLADGAAVSFAVSNVPGHFIRHAGFHLFIAPNDGTALFRQDATFTQMAPNSR
jgi:hypothetical protein